MTGVRLAAVVAVTLGLSACGYSVGDRALSGAGIGAAGGAAIGALTGDPLKGAIIGGIGGGAIGALTDPRQVQGGRPLWR